MAGQPDVSASDRFLVWAFAGSLGLHIAVLIGQGLAWPWFRRPTNALPIRVVYDQEVVRQEAQRLRDQLSRAKRESAGAPMPGLPGERLQIRIPERPSLIGQSIADLMPSRAAVVDLTNLVDAARGDPLLLTYFGALREQIQETANRRPWVSGGTEGMVYVSFELLASGAVRSAEVLAERSVPAAELREAAVRIVKTAAPFPPFPPSMAETSKTILVPLEFLVQAP